MECNCDLCKREAEWEAVHNTCFRCSHDLPCQIAHEKGHPCTGEEEDPECEDCPGWAIFNGDHIERCDTCARLPDDDEAIRLARGAGLSVGDDGHLFGYAHEVGHFGVGKNRKTRRR